MQGANKWLTKSGGITRVLQLLYHEKPCCGHIQNTPLGWKNKFIIPLPAVLKMGSNLHFMEK